MNILFICLLLNTLLAFYAWHKAFAVKRHAEWLHEKIRMEAEYNAGLIDKVEATRKESREALDEAENILNMVRAKCVKPLTEAESRN